MTATTHGREAVSGSTLGPAAVAASLGRPLRLGTRGSQLARIQSTIVADALRQLGVEVELVTIVTEGDRRPPDEVWGEGAFVTALQDALLEGRVDLAVHSAKDVPIEADAEARIGAYPERADPRDALVLRAGASVRDSADPLAALEKGAVVGTDSPRRAGFLLAARPDLRIVPLHGNVDTRLRRLDGGQADALVLAVAGLSRLGRQDRVSAPLEADLVPPAPGQGALAIEVRPGDGAVRELVARLDHGPTRTAVTAERALLETTGGGCRAPIGALARVDEGQFFLLAGAVEQNGSKPRFVRYEGAVEDAHEIAVAAGTSLAVGRSLVPGPLEVAP